MLTTWNSSDSPGRVSVVAAIALCLALTAAVEAAAQTREVDARWQPWLGCWTASPPRAVISDPAEAQQVCVVPAPGVSAVDVVTVSGSRIVSREHIDASGEHRKSERDGCVGWESAEWSSDMRRVYLKSEYECTGGLERGTTGLMATAANGDWLDVVGVAVRDNIGVRVLRHRASVLLSRLPAEIASAVDGASRATALRTLLPVGDPEIIDASHHVSAAVVEAWLAESRQAFTVNAARLVALADAGVDGRVIDMMVALSYPKAFAIKPSPTSVGALATDEGRGGIATGLGGLGSFSNGLGSFSDCGPYSSGLSLYGWDGCSPYGYGMYGSQYGYSRYSNLLGYDGWYVAGAEPIVIVRPGDQGGSSSSSTHGQVVNGRGYSAGDSGSTASSGSSGGSSSGSSGSSGGGSSTSSGGDRTAVPR
jgi:hypothetical protein